MINQELQTSDGANNRNRITTAEFSKTATALWFLLPLTTATALRFLVPLTTAETTALRLCEHLFKLRLP